MDDFDVPVLVQIPRQRFKTLNREAIKQGVEVSSLLRALVIKVIPEAPIPLTLTVEERDDYIRLRNGEGALDSEIAAEIGLSNTQTAFLRKKLELPSNGRVKRAKVPR